MSKRLICYYHGNPRRAEKIAFGLASGGKIVGWDTHAIRGCETEIRSDIVAGYGWILKPAFFAYKARNRPFVYADLGYWHRKPEKSRYSGYHKLVVSDKHSHPNLNKVWDSDRFNVLNIPVQPWRDNPQGGILVAGMSAKNAVNLGFQEEEFERRAIAQLRSVGYDGPIIYRPKPSWHSARPIRDTIYSPPEEPLETVLERVRGIVTHSSNVAVDALVLGLPFYCEDGIARALSVPAPESLLSRCREPVQRMNMLHAIAYHQWNLQEMVTGEAWQWMISEGMI